MVGSSANRAFCQPILHPQKLWRLREWLAVPLGRRFANHFCTRKSCGEPNIGWQSWQKGILPTLFSATKSLRVKKKVGNSAETGFCQVGKSEKRPYCPPFCRLKARKQARNLLAVQAKRHFAHSFRAVKI